MKRPMILPIIIVSLLGYFSLAMERKASFQKSRSGSATPTNTLKQHFNSLQFVQKFISNLINDRKSTVDLMIIDSLYSKHPNEVNNVLIEVGSWLMAWETMYMVQVKDTQLITNSFVYKKYMMINDHIKKKKFNN